MGTAVHAGHNVAAMTAAVLAQQTDAGHLAGLGAGLALMFVGVVLILVGVVMTGRHLIRWWERRDATAADDGWRSR